MYRESKEEQKNLENVIQSLASPIKQCVKQNLLDSVLSDVIVNVNTTSVHETTVLTNLIDYLKCLNKNRQYLLMHETMSKIFKDKLTDPSFLSWLASKLNIRTSRFLIYVANWRDRNFKETRSTANSIDDELKQEIFDTWVENSINSTDRRNGRNLVSISKSKYNELFHNIENKMVSVNVNVVNKRGRTLYQANRTVLTCTVCDIQKKLFESATKFFMSSCDCDKGANGYYKWKCVNLKCKD